MMKPFFLLTVYGILLAVSYVTADLYNDLELEQRESSTDKDIKKQFRILSKKYHPDVNPSENARQIYQRIQRAHEVLSDRRKRKMYDIRGEEGVKQLEAAQQQGASNSMASFFGSSGNGEREVTSVNVQISLEDVYIGRTTTVNLRKQKLCRTCKGTGAASMDDLVKCSKCHGSGRVVARMQFGPFVQQVEQQCPTCNGKGKKAKHVCPLCKGAKVARGDHSFTVEVERGIPHGHEIVYEMEADEYPDQIPADLKIILNIKKHFKFEREGIHLKTTLMITLLESLVGFEKTIKHLDGHTVMISRSDMTPYGTIITLPGKGMPTHNVPSEHGDLLVHIQVKFPTTIAEEKKGALEALLTEIEKESSQSI